MHLRQRIEVKIEVRVFNNRLLRFTRNDMGTIKDYFAITRNDNKDDNGNRIAPLKNNGAQGRLR